MASSGSLAGRRTADWSDLLPAALASAAFLQTLAYYFYLRNDAGNYNGAGALGDQVSYIGLSQQVSHGTWEGASHYMPGLPALLAIAQLLTGDARLGIALLQGAVFAVLVLGAGRLAAAVWGPRARPWASGLIALNPTLGYYAAQALTEFFTGALVFAAAAFFWRWSQTHRMGDVVGCGVCVALAGYLRSEYLAFAGVFAVVLLILADRQASLWQQVKPASLLVMTLALLMAPWVLRYWIATGKPALYNESPVANLVLMGTWFRSFDEQTFARLQLIENQPGSRADAVAAASQIGPNPELARRYMEQVRGPYDLPLGETLQIAVGNIRLDLRHYLLTHFGMAPILIWAGHTPVRQSDTGSFPVWGRYVLWGGQLALLLLALWQAIVSLRRRSAQAPALAFLGVFVLLTAVHTLIAVDDRFTVPALPLAMFFAGAWIAERLPRAAPAGGLPG